MDTLTAAIAGAFLALLAATVATFLVGHRARRRRARRAPLAIVAGYGELRRDLAAMRGEAAARTERAIDRTERTSGLYRDLEHLRTGREPE